MLELLKRFHAWDGRASHRPCGRLTGDATEPEAFDYSMT